MKRPAKPSDVSPDCKAAFDKWIADRKAIGLQYAGIGIPEEAFACGWAALRYGPPAPLKGAPKTGSSLATITDWFISKVPAEDQPYAGFKTWKRDGRWYASVHTVGGGVGGNATTPEDAILAGCMTYLRLAGIEY